jgi:hypothetical protein
MIESSKVEIAIIKFYFLWFSLFGSCAPKLPNSRVYVADFEVVAFPFVGLDNWRVKMTDS